MRSAITGSPSLGRGSPSPQRVQMGCVACTAKGPLLLRMLDWREAFLSLSSPVSMGLPAVIPVERNSMGGWCE